MYLSELSIKNFRSFDEKGVTIKFKEGLTAIVGENDSGKTAIIDSLRHLLSTTDQDWLRFTQDDFHQSLTNGNSASEIQISATFENLTQGDKSGFAEYLTYGNSQDEQPTLHVTLNAKQNGRKSGRLTTFTEVRSGLNGDGPTIDSRARALLAATYLRPLRDAEDELSSGRNSRLSMVLHALGGIDEGDKFDSTKEEAPSLDAEQINKLSLLGLGDYFNQLIENHVHITKGSSKVNEHLEAMQLSGELFNSRISVSSSGSDSLRLRQLLEKLNLSLGNASGRMGLGSNNILFMACELLLLADEQDSFPMLLIEEPEAHVHAQRQVRLIRYLQNIASNERTDGQKPQIIITTHSPNLASEISTDNLVVVKSGSAFSMSQEQTKLEQSDYRFLNRFLDVTKANLFFARSVDLLPLI
ncbi:ATP-dependent nuclease [Vibrio natriegens]|uniref:ATP-dependent nuclease n=1 Tax=Vibrio natriegens TaxID=691 RepID=UPI003B59EDA8